MSEKWDFFLSTRQGKPASIFVDIGIAQEAPRQGYPVRLGVLVKQKSPRPDGLTTKEEADRLWAVEDALVPAVAAWGGVYVGRMTTDGRRDYFFYAPSSGGFGVMVTRVMEPFAYSFRAVHAADPDWSYYFRALYPTPRDWQRIMNRHVLENPQRGGDDLSKSRRIFHWLYFSSEANRDLCAEAARGRGFGTRLLPASPKPDNKFPLGLQLHRIDSVAPKAIDDLSMGLLALAQENGGQYDGWETQLVKPGHEPIDDSPDR